MNLIYKAGPSKIDPDPSKTNTESNGPFSMKSDFDSCVKAEMLRNDKINYNYIIKMMRSRPKLSERSPASSKFTQGS